MQQQLASALTVVLCHDLEGSKHLSGDQLECLRVTHGRQRHKHSSGLDSAVAGGDAVALKRLATPQQLRACGVECGVIAQGQCGVIAQCEAEERGCWRQ